MCVPFPLFSLKLSQTSSKSAMKLSKRYVKLSKRYVRIRHIFFTARKSANCFFQSDKREPWWTFETTRMDDLHQTSTYPCRCVLISIPFAQTVIDIQHSCIVEDVRGRSDSVYPRDSSMLVSVQMSSPDRPSTRSAVA